MDCRKRVGSLQGGWVGGFFNGKYYQKNDFFEWMRGFLDRDEKKHVTFVTGFL